MAKNKILVIDDDAEFDKVIELRLEAAGYEVLVAYEGRASLEKAHKERPDLILLDIAMPDFDGFQVLKALKEMESTKSIPVIMITAKNQTDHVKKAVDLGAAAYIIKPFDAVLLLQTIHKALAEPG